MDSGAPASAAEDLDDVTGRPVAEMEEIAEELYQHRDKLDGDVVPSEPASEVRSVVSVRFSRAELDDIAAAATLAGQPLSTYIRKVALGASPPR